MSVIRNKQNTLYTLWVYEETGEIQLRTFYLFRNTIAYEIFFCRNRTLANVF